MKKPAPSPAADWEVLPTTPWNYGLVLDPADAGSLVVDEGVVGDVPFAAATPAVTIRVTGRRMPEWQLEEGSAGTLPLSPADQPRAQRKPATGPLWGLHDCG